MIAGAVRAERLCGEEIFRRQGSDEGNADEHGEQGLVSG